MLDVMRSHGFVPEEIYSEQGKTAHDCFLSKVVLYDIVWQARTSVAIISIDAAN